MTRSEIKQAKRIVVKIGTSSITHESGRLDTERIDLLAKALAGLKSGGCEVVLVSSGAISAGVDRLNLNERPKSVSGRQAAAAVGQSALMEIYSKSFAKYGCLAAQILLTKDVLEKEVSKKNAENTFNELLEMGVIPVINENDTISTDEICFGDNDNLSACVAVLVKADLLVLLTDTDGVFDSDPNENGNAKLLTRVEYKTDLSGVIGSGTNKFGTGGMLSKVNAAKTAVRHGINAVIANAKNDNTLADILSGSETGTWFEKGNFSRMSAAPDDEFDPLFPEVLKLCIMEEKAHISLIQRKFCMGYNRAGKIIAEMERMGYISGQVDMAPRKVLITMEEYNAIFE